MSVDIEPATNVLFKDAWLLVMNKPSGLAVHRGWARERETLLSVARRIARQHVYPCHRLDRGTSGVLVFTLSAELAARVQEQFVQRSVQKSYLAWVRGLCPVEGLIDHAIAKQPGAVKRAAQTAIRRLASVEFENPRNQKYPLRYSLTLAQPLSGRLHQIRRHLKHLSHPIIGDTKYGKSEHNRYCSSAFGLNRLALHAATLSMAHPISGEPLTFEAPIPLDLSVPLVRAGLGDAMDAHLSGAFQPLNSSELTPLG